MKLIVIDPHITEKSPTMRGWVRAFDGFCDLFDEIEIWASECSPSLLGRVKWIPFLQRIPTWRLHAIDFQQRVRKAAAQQSMDDTLLQVTGCLLPVADIRYIQYWSRSLLDEQRKRPETFKLSVSQKFSTKLAARTEGKVVANSASTKWWWVASRSLADEIKSQNAKGDYRVLPNHYDPERFNHAVRHAHRDRVRETYGIQSDEKVAVFSAFGHFERKGLIQAIEAINILVERGHKIRFLILGGIPETLNKFRKTLRLAGITDQHCIFAGTVNEIEQHLSAADAFLFPSHFEAFSLAEIEAAALGLRLYLTPHYGSEMILRETENGRFLPWTSQGMAAVMEDDLDQGVFCQSHKEMAEAVSPEQFRSKLRSFYIEAIQSKRISRV